MKIEIQTPPAWPPARRRPPECLSDFFLERLQHGELRGDAGAAGRRHLEGCQACRQRAAALTVAGAGKEAPAAIDLDAILAAVPAAGSPGRDAGAEGRAAAGAGTWRRLPAVVGAGAAALGAVLWVVGGAPGLEREQPREGARAVGSPPAEQVKGPPSWRLRVLRHRPGGGSEPVAAGGPVRPGDRIRFEISAPEDAFAAVVSLDARGVVTAFYPAAGEAVAVGRGRPHLSTHGVALDDTLGPERLILVGCPRPRPVDEVVAAARRALARAAGKAQGVDRLDLPCEQTTFWLTKVAR